MEEMWLARDEDELLYLFFGRKPVKTVHSWYNWSKDYYEIKASLFPQVKWSDDEPTKVKLVIDKYGIPKRQTNKESDPA